MTNKQKCIGDIIKDIFSLESPKIAKKREEEIAEFIEVAVNGDQIDSHLALDISNEDRPSISVFILTNKRLIQVDIEIDTGIKSSVYLLNEIIGVERKLIESDRMEVGIIFKNGLIRLRHPKKASATTTFFQKIEQTWAGRV